MSRFFYAHFIKDYRLMSLVVAVLLYGAFGSPTPDTPGALEAALALLLVIAVSPAGLLNAVRFNRAAPVWAYAGHALLIFGMSVPVLVGVVNGHDVGVMLRDIIPFLFMLLPVFCVPLIRGQDGVNTALIYAVVALGVVFALRAQSNALPFLASGEALFYLANAPTVLFAAIFLAGTGLQNFIERFSIRALPKTLALLALSALCVSAMVEVQQRASVALYVLCIAAILARHLWRFPKRTLVVFAFTAVAVFMCQDQIGEIYEALSRKTALVGANMRFEEWAAVWREIARSPLSLLFGQGWGGAFSSPAVADIKVHYTHGLVSSLLLKTGLVGFGLGGVYLIALGRELWRCAQKTTVLFMALSAPFLIDIFLYASFKSLDFGLILLLIVWVRGVASGAGLLYAEGDSKQPQ